ncbi:MAG: hypothetical protein ACK5MT_19190 [Actinomycetales bacterium]
MSHFTHDIMQMGPAPTMARELPVALANTLFTILVLAVAVAVTGGFGLPVIGAAVFLFGYTAVRLVWVAVRGPVQVPAAG